MKIKLDVDAILLEMQATQEMVQQEIDLDQSDESAINEAIPSVEEILEEYVMV